MLKRQNGFLKHLLLYRTFQMELQLRESGITTMVLFNKSWSKNFQILIFSFLNFTTVFETLYEYFVKQEVSTTKNVLDDQHWVPMNSQKMFNKAWKIIHRLNWRIFRKKLDCPWIHAIKFWKRGSFLRINCMLITNFCRLMITWWT